MSESTTTIGRELVRGVEKKKIIILKIKNDKRYNINTGRGCGWSLFFSRLLKAGFFYALLR